LCFLRQLCGSYWLNGNLKRCLVIDEQVIVIDEEEKEK